MTPLTLTIDGMHCNGCVKNVTRTLEQIDGVTLGAVAIGSATLEYDPARTGPDALAAAVTDAGYPAHA